jgi:hypothetical protein
MGVVLLQLRKCMTIFVRSTQTAQRGRPRQGAAYQISRNRFYLEQPGQGRLRANFSETHRRRCVVLHALLLLVPLE